MVRLMVLTLAAAIGGCPAKREAPTRAESTASVGPVSVGGGKPEVALVPAKPPGGGQPPAQAIPAERGPEKSKAAAVTPTEADKQVVDAPKADPKPATDLAVLTPGVATPPPRRSAKKKLGSSKGGKPLTASSDRKPPVQDEETSTTLRAGALRVESHQSDQYYIRYEADRTLQIAKLRAALGKRRLGARVAPFTQTDAPGSVKHGGQIVAVAVAQQLQTMGWLVDLASAETMLKAARKIVPAADLSRAFAELRVSGQVSFTASTTKDVTVAAIEGHVAFSDDVAPVFRCRLAAESRVVASDEPVLSRRLERATREALRSFVRLLFERRDLAARLVAFVKKR